MKTLKSYAKDLDSKVIPKFLSQFSEKMGPASSSGECTISLFEVLARVHGRNIVPQIDDIMTTIIRTLSSSVGSFPLHQACSKVVPAIAHYGIDPSISNAEKTKIISSLCKPLSNVLMGSQENLASGSALCLKALIESNNWKFASNDMVNEVCLKVAGALEEKTTQTNSHIGVVMSLVKHNVLIVEAYARSLIRSGLQILTAVLLENDSQKRFSAIQMINFLMKCVDSRSISSELADVVDVMGKCQADHMPYVRGAAFEALKTAKSITLQKGSEIEISSSPITWSNFYRRDDKSPRARKDYLTEFASPESQTVDSCITYDAFTDSPVSIEQYPRNFEYDRQANRRPWNSDTGGVDISLKDGLFPKTCSNYGDSKYNGELSNKDKLHLESFSGFVHSRPTSTTSRDATPSPQRSHTDLTIDDIKIFSTPRKLVPSLRGNTVDNSSGGENPKINANPTSCEVKRNPMAAEIERTRKDEKISRMEERSVIDGSDTMPSPDDLLESCAENEKACKDGTQVCTEIVRKSWYGKAAVNISWALVLVFLAIVFPAMRFDNDKVFSDVVAT